MHKEMCRR